MYMKINHLKLLVLIFSAIVLFISCEKDITVNLPKQKQQYVVEGYIENGLPAYVMLSKTADYFSPVDSTALQQYMVKNATIVISDGDITDTLLQVDPSIGYFYFSPKIIGQTGKNYSLRIITPSKESSFDKESISE